MTNLGRHEAIAPQELPEYRVSRGPDRPWPDPHAAWAASPRAANWS